MAMDNSRASQLHLQIALDETETQIVLMSQRAQQLAVRLHEAENTARMLGAQLVEEQAKNVGLSSKLEELKRSQVTPQ